MKGKCNKIEDTCGKRINARCSDYEGSVNDKSELDPENECLNLHDTTEDIYEQLDTICDNIDLSELGEDCLDYDEEEEELRVKTVLKKFEEEICALKEEVEVDEEDPNYCNPIFEADISCLNLDYKCLQDPCNNEINTLKDLLQSLIDNHCTCCDENN